MNGFEGLLGYALVAAVVLGVIYVIFRETGIEAKLQRFRKKQIEQLKVGWGVEEIKRLTHWQIKDLMKFGESVNKNIYLGINKLGKAKKRIKIKGSTYIYEIKKGFLGSTYYFIINNKEITHSDAKNIYLKDAVVFNQFGVYHLENDIKEKRDYIKFLIEKMNSEDVWGRISNLASKTIYLDLTHAQNIDLLMKKIEAIEKMRGSEEKGLQDFLTA